MNLKFRSHTNISNFDRDLIKSINLPEIEQYFILSTIKGLKTDIEDIQLVCIHKKKDGKKELTEELYKRNNTGIYVQSENGIKLRKVKNIDIKELATDSSASASIDPNEINKKCPKNDYYRVWYHTHNHSVSAQSTDDRFANEKLFSENIGDGMCACGINGVTCHFPNSDPPAIASGRWKSNFWMQLKNLNNQLDLVKPINNLDENLSVKKVFQSEADQVLCYSMNINNQQKHLCYGRNWKNGINMFELGKFDSLYLDGPSENSMNLTISTPRDFKYNCISLKTNSVGDKLVCH